MSMSNARHDEMTGTTCPSDKEVVGLLQRLASARAQLLQAESAAEDALPDMSTAAERNDEIEDAHIEVLWAQAELITAHKEQRAQRAVEQAKQREKQALRRYGLNTFGEYLAQRTTVPACDIYLEVARREFAAAQGEWDLITREVAMSETSSPPTIVVDLTGDSPRRIA
jgi:hypothetical protein